MKIIGNVLTFKKDNLIGKYTKRGKTVTIHDEDKSKDIVVSIGRETKTHIQGIVKTHKDITKFKSLEIEDWGHDDVKYYVVTSK